MDESKPLLTVIFKKSAVLHKKIKRIARTNLSKCVDDAIGIGRQHVIDMTAELVLQPDREALNYVDNCFSSTSNPNTAEMYFHYWNTNPLKGCGVDAFGKRVHSVVTNMPKVLRRCLRFIDDPTMPVAELDIVNSQPFFLSVLSAVLVDTFVPECAAAVAICRRYEANADYIWFRKLCGNGLIYEELSKQYENRYGCSYGVADNDAREVTKGLVYGVFFSDYSKAVNGLNRVSYTEHSKLKKNFFRLFMDIFPSVYSSFKEIKSLYWSFTVNRQGVHKQYANNCLLAQRLESAIMFDCLLPALLDRGINCVVTVHDCCIIRRADVAAVKRVMLDTFQSLGLHPEIKVVS